MEERIQKIIASRGFCSRRAAEKLIEEGRVRKNGRRIKLGDTADPRRDIIAIDGKKLPFDKDSKNVYILLHKPRGYVATMSDDRGRKAVTELLTGVKERVFPVGRLDMASEGLLVFTNDGKLANVLTHPSFEVAKEYLVTVTGETEAAVEQMEAGMTLDDGFETAPAEVRVVRAFEDKTILSVTIRQGHNRQVRRMCEAAGLEVRRLVRVSIGRLSLEGIPTGKWRYADQKEEKYLAGLSKKGDEKGPGA